MTTAPAQLVSLVLTAIALISVCLTTTALLVRCVLADIVAMAVELVMTAPRGMSAAMAFVFPSLRIAQKTPNATLTRIVSTACVFPFPAYATTKGGVLQVLSV
jgi:hypothetical protein